MSETVETMKREYEARRAAFEIFDTNAWWDPRKTDCFRPVSDFAQWNTELRRFGIGSALVTHIDSAMYDAAYGNERLAELLGGSDTLHGCMVLVPEMPAEYIGGMLNRGFAAARMFPKTYKHSMRGYAAGRLLAALEERRVPLLLWHSEVDWDAMDEICRSYPRLPVVVEGHNIKLLYHARNYIALLREHQNFHLETHNVVLFDELSNLAREFGAARLLYGSYFPYNTPHHSLMNVTAAQLDDKDTAAILGGNFKRLMAGIVR